MKRLMLAAMHSGAGKTVTTCALLAALKRRGLDVRAFKCGPDYIDPMFHSRVLQVPSRNLDLFLQGREGVQVTLARGRGEIAVLEGAMGFYDGLAGTDAASAWQVARESECPVILVARPKGVGLTLAAQIRGLLSFREPSQLAGLLLADCPPSLAAYLRPLLEGETGLPLLGFLPPMEEAKLESRHLGLLTAGEISDLSRRFDRIAAQMEETVDIDALLELATEHGGTAEEPQSDPVPDCRIAVAWDEACCFYYQDNLDLLRRCGAELVFFSPLRDRELPSCDGLYLGGGYPELYCRQLAENGTMRRSIAESIAGGLPTVAECGGFLLLHQTLEDAEGRAWPMCGVIPGAGVKTGRLQRFGYHCLQAKGDSLLLRRGEQVPVHEFHYWDSTANGECFISQKPDGREWSCGHATDTLFAAFPHLHFGGQLPLAQRFCEACRRPRGEG